jgi:hypothetical protein
MTEGRTTDVPVPVASVAARQGLGNLTLGVQLADGSVIFGNPRGRDGITARMYQRMLGRIPCHYCAGKGDHLSPGPNDREQCSTCHGKGWLP